MKIFLPLFFFVNITTVSLCQTISGVVTDEKGNPLPYASVTVQGSTHGTSANNEGN